DDKTRAIRAAGDHLFRYSFHGREALPDLAAGQKQGIVRLPDLERLPLMTPDIVGSDDEYFAGLWREMIRNATEDAALHNGTVVVLGLVDFERGNIQLGYALINP